MVCYAPRLEAEMGPNGRASLRAEPRMAPAVPWARSSAPRQAPDAPRARAPLFLVREAVAYDGGYRVAVGEVDEVSLAHHDPAGSADAAALPEAEPEIYTAALPESEVCAAALPESDGDVMDALEEEIVVLSAHIHAATNRLLTLIAQYDRLRGWELAGHRSCAHWLAYRTGLDLGTAREKVRAARALERLPQTSAAMARGELSFSQVRALSRVATAENEGDLLELARGCTTAQLERMVRAFRKGSEADEAAAEKRRYQSRTLSVFPDDDGMYVVRGRLTAEEGALLMRAIEAAGDALYREERWSPAVVKAAAARGHVLEGEPEREAAQRRADALGLVAERALAAGFGGRRRREGEENEGEDPIGAKVEDAANAQPEDRAEPESTPTLPVPISGSRAERYQVVLHVETETLLPLQEPNPWEGGGSAGIGEDVSYESSGAEGTHVGPALRSVVSRTGARGRPAQSHLRPLGSCERSTGDKPTHPSLATPKSELDDGTRLSHETSRRLCCDASVVRLTKGADGSILDVGRRTRTIPPALRRALEARDRGCRFPGCGSRFTDAHHVIPWAAGGDTSLGNCVLLCKYHHRLVHEGGWTVDWWGEGRPVFYDPRGGVHCEVRWEAPARGEALPKAHGLGEELADGSDPGKGWAETHDQGGRMVKTLIQENQQRGVEPDPWALGPRWKREEDIPDSVYFGAMEALS